MEDGKTIVKGLSFVDALQIVFIVLKLVGVLTWKWVWVLAPLWISFALVIVLCLIEAILMFVINR